MTSPDLLEFLNKRMSMTGLYQPVIIRELLLYQCVRTKAELAAILASVVQVVRGSMPGSLAVRPHASGMDARTAAQPHPSASTPPPPLASRPSMH
jgi:hypothetical protein